MQRLEWVRRAAGVVHERKVGRGPRADFMEHCDERGVRRRLGLTRKESDMANAVRKGLILAVLGLAAAMSAVGQDGGQPNGPAPASTKPVGTPTALGLLGGQPSVLSLSFSGGTVGEYVEALRAQSAVGANISLGPAVAEMPMPPIQLRDVVLSVAVRAVETVTDSQGAPMMLTRSIVGEGGEPLFVISARADGASGGGSIVQRCDASGLEARSRDGAEDAARSS